MEQVNAVKRWYTQLNVVWYRYNGPMLPYCALALFPATIGYTNWPMLQRAQETIAPA